MSRIAPFLAWLAFVAVVGTFLLDYFIPYNDTDPPGARSGFKLYTDHLTGCQYLRAGLLGGTTPRLDRNGRQICGEPK